MIGIFSRSHYANVLTNKVHTELVLNEHIPGIICIDDISDNFWKERYKQNRRFEKNHCRFRYFGIEFFS